MKLTAEEVIKATNAVVIENKTQDEGFSISTDTRTIKKGDIYLPLKGANFDGENFISTAIENGASGYFTTSGKTKSADLILQIPDALAAYLQTARFLRAKIAPQTIAVTGSSGKTTTKEMIYAVTSQKFKTHKTALNHNNEIGLCQTILSMPVDTEVLILEMGMRGLGEIELLSKYAEPDIAVIANVGTAHIGRLGSRENIAKAKCEITEYLKLNGVLIAHDDELIKKTCCYKGESVYYSVKDTEITEKKVGNSKFIYKDFEYELNVEGEYNIENATAAIEAGLHLGMTCDEIKKGLKTYHPIEKRWEALKINGYTIINDSYNANPESMMAAVSTFIELYENPVVILGDMGELGEDEITLHAAVGEYLAAGSGNVKYLTVGKLAAVIGERLMNSGFKVKCFETNKDVSLYILDNIKKDNTIFLKASRSMKFEEILKEIDK